MLPNLSISNFRTFQQLDIERFGQVNLIAGKNNTGKTCLLEALHVYTNRSSGALREILMRRREVRRNEQQEAEIDLQSIFNGRPNCKAKASLSLLSQDEKRLEIRSTWIKQEVSESGASYLKELPELSNGETQGLGIFWSVILEFEGRKEYLAPTVSPSTAIRPKYAKTVFLPAENIEDEVAAAWWDAITLSNGEENILQNISLIAPIERISLVKNPASANSRHFLVRMKNETSPVPLRSLGAGVHRLFHCLLAIEYTNAVRHESQATILSDNADLHRSRYLFVDEIENGIHYSVLSNFWNALFELAKRYQMQLFATTHSWDCIEAFQNTAESDTDTDAVLIRLDRQGNNSKAYLFSESDLSIATRDHIEVR